MSDENETEVKPEEEVPEEETETINPESSQEETESENESEESEEETEEEEEPEQTKPSEPVKVEIPDDGLAIIENETPREHALRLEIKRLRDDKTKERTKEIFEPPKSEIPVKTESEVLNKYKPEEIKSLREVFPELAKELGFVKKDELIASSYEEKAQEQIDSFISAHPEYSPEKDPDGTLWNRLKGEYQSVYKPPQNPKDFKKIFERIHKDLFGIQVSGPLPKIDAAKEKVKVASHSGASVPREQEIHRSKNGTSYRLDALKGFSEEDIADLRSRADE